MAALVILSLGGGGKGQKVTPWLAFESLRGRPPGKVTSLSLLSYFDLRIYPLAGKGFSGLRPEIGKH